MVIEVLETDQVDDSTSTLENICRNEKLVSEHSEKLVSEHSEKLVSEHSEKHMFSNVDVESST
jgi:hypothetical protein